MDLQYKEHLGNTWQGDDHKLLWESYKTREYAIWTYCRAGGNIHSVCFIVLVKQM
jgi:hypothetical protein